jgi:hypothetical protein
MWLQQGAVTWNKGFIELENESRIIASSTSSDSTRGYSYNFIMLDEFAFVPENIAEEFMTSTYPTISSGRTTKIAILSTPNGMNLFYKYWTDAVNGKNSYSPFDIHWSQVPIYTQEWYEETMKNMTQEQFDQEYGIDFLGSSNTLISSSKLKAIPWIEAFYQNEWIRCYEKPIEGHSYVLVADTGKGQGLDSSAFSVIDVTSIPYKQVCIYKNNTIDAMSYPTAIVNTAKKYNDAWVLIEINPPGDQVAHILANDYEYEHVYHTTTRGRGGQQLSQGFKGSSRPGVTTSVAVKIQGCNNIKTMIETNQFLIQDYWTLTELSNFTVNGKSFAANVGHHDDIVMGLVLFGWLAMQPMFKEMTNMDIRAKLHNINTLAKDENPQTLPFGFSSNDLLPQTMVDQSGEIWEVIDNEYTRLAKKQQRFWNDFDYAMEDFDVDAYDPKKGHIF